MFINMNQKGEKKEILFLFDLFINLTKIKTNIKYFL